MTIVFLLTYIVIFISLIIWTRKNAINGAPFSTTGGSFFSLLISFWGFGEGGTPVDHFVVESILIVVGILFSLVFIAIGEVYIKLAKKADL